MICFNVPINRKNINANLLSEVYKNTNYVISKDNTLYVYSDEDGCFHPSDYNEIAADMKASLDEESQIKISQRDYKEAVDLLGISKELSEDKEFFENKPFVNCLNGVVDICSGELLDHSPDFRFKPEKLPKRSSMFPSPKRCFSRYAKLPNTPISA